MGNGTSIGKFNGLTTAGGGVLRDVGSLSRDPGALGGNANALIGNPDALSSNPDTLSFDPVAISRDPKALRFDPDALSFDVFHQEPGSNSLISSHLRGMASKPSKFAFSQTLNLQPSTLN
jgi:hypothetical protein